MTPKLAPFRRLLSVLTGAAVIAAIFAMAALFGALVANATASAPVAGGRLAFSGVSYLESCWSAAAASDDLGQSIVRMLNLCD